MAMDLEKNGFILRSTDANKPPTRFFLRASEPEMMQDWTNTISSILQKQTELIKALQSPIAYQKERTKDNFQ